MMKIKLQNAQLLLENTIIQDQLTTDMVDVWA